MRQSRRRLLVALCVFAACAESLAQTAGNSERIPANEALLPIAINFVQDAKVLREKSLPIVVLFNLPGCPHCESVRSSYLQPLMSERPPRATVRQVDIDSEQSLVDFDGTTTTHRAFAAKHRAKLAPTVGFFGANGESIAEPLVGAMLADFYGAYLEEALASATKRANSVKSN
jgi:thioredoxin-related protein